VPREVRTAKSIKVPKGWEGLFGALSALTDWLPVWRRNLFVIGVSFLTDFWNTPPLPPGARACACVRPQAEPLAAVRHRRGIALLLLVHFVLLGGTESRHQAGAAWPDAVWVIRPATERKGEQMADGPTEAPLSVFVATSSSQSCEIARNTGSCALLVQAAGKLRWAKACSKQIQVCTSIHLPFDHLDL
jgi:hypothetical protein